MGRRARCGPRPRCRHGARPSATAPTSPGAGHGGARRTPTRASLRRTGRAGGTAGGRGTRSSGRGARRVEVEPEAPGRGGPGGRAGRLVLLDGGVLAGLVALREGARGLGGVG